jgi:hypothetical protein
MTKEQINNIINNYDDLTRLAKSKIKIMEQIDSKYNTAKNIMILLPLK